MSSVILDFSALILVMVSNRNLLVKRTGVSLMTRADDDDVGVVGCFRAAAAAAAAAAKDADDADADDEDDAPVPDDGNKHLLYIVAVGRLNGIILHR